MDNHPEHMMYDNARFKPCNTYLKLAKMYLMISFADDNYFPITEVRGYTFKMIIY